MSDPQCLCSEYWPDDGHPPDCPVQQRIDNLRVRLRKVQRAARRNLGHWDGSHRWLRDTPGDDNSWEWMACPHCYRALPEEGECRCGGEHA